jgi:hypothetical protein
MGKLFDIAFCLADLAAFSPSTDPTPRLYVTQFVALLSRLREGNNRYHTLLRIKVGEVLPNLQLPRPVYTTHNVGAASMGAGASGVRTLPSNTSAAGVSPSIPSTSYQFPESMNQLAAPTGMQLSSNPSQQALLDDPSFPYQDVSAYNPPSSHTSRLAYRRQPQPGTLGPYEAPLGGGPTQPHYHEEGDSFNPNPTGYGERSGGLSLDAWREATSTAGEIHGQSDPIYAQNTAAGGPLGRGYAAHGQG